MAWTTGVDHQLLDVRAPRVRVYRVELAVEERHARRAGEYGPVLMALYSYGPIVMALYSYGQRVWPSQAIH